MHVPLWDAMVGGVGKNGMGKKKSPWPQQTASDSIHEESLGFLSYFPEEYFGLSLFLEKMMIFRIQYFRIQYS